MTNKDDKDPEVIDIELNQSQKVDDDDDGYFVLSADIHGIETEIEVEDAVVILAGAISKTIEKEDIEDAVIIGDEQHASTDDAKQTEVVQDKKTVHVVDIGNTIDSNITFAHQVDETDVYQDDEKEVIDDVVNPHKSNVSKHIVNDSYDDVVANADKDSTDDTVSVNPKKSNISKNIVSSTPHDDVIVVDTVKDDVVEMGIDASKPNTTKYVVDNLFEDDDVIVAETMIVSDKKSSNHHDLDDIVKDDGVIEMGVANDTTAPAHHDKPKESDSRVGYLQTYQSQTIHVETSLTSYTPEPTSVSQPTLDVSEDSIHKKNTLFPKNFTKPLLFLVGSSVAGIWVMQQSINAYFVQTYHKPSPLANIDNGAWKAGAKVHDGLAQVKQGAQNPEMDISSVPNPDTPSQPAAVAQEVPPPTPTMTTEQVKEDIIKASLTLNKTQKVFFAGDSLMQGVAPHIQKHLQQVGIQSINLSKQSTGLAYPKFFDWQTTIKETIGKDKDIKVLVVMLGPNDPWDMPVKGSGKYLKFKSPEWDSEYQSRMADILNFTKENNVGVIWVTPPNMRKEKLDAQMMHINDVMIQELERHHVQIIDARPVMGSIDNKYSDYLIKDDKKIKMRTGDGIHFTPDGQRELARHIQSFLTIEP